jgi:hypothetical protein
MTPTLQETAILFGVAALWGMTLLGMGRLVLWCLAPRADR